MIQQSSRKPQKRLHIVGATLAGVALVAGAGAFGLHALRNHAPDTRREIASPDGRFRLVITEELAGFPGQVCIEEVYALGAGAELDRNDQNARVFAGACGGLLDIRWAGPQVEGTVDLQAAASGVAGVTMRESGADRKVRIHWRAGPQVAATAPSTRGNPGRPIVK